MQDENDDEIQQVRQSLMSNGKCSHMEQQQETISVNGDGFGLIDDEPPEIGFPKDLFIYCKDTQGMECVQCGYVCAKPMLLGCKHYACASCIKPILQCQGDSKCPKDKKLFDPTALEIDRTLQETIKNLEMRCRNSDWGCTCVAKCESFQEHMTVCEYEEILCTNDCGAKFQRRFQQKHLDKDCSKKIISCSFCDERIYREDKKEHLQECLKIPLPCPNKCDKTRTFPRDEIDLHIDNECPRTKMVCDYEPISCQHRCSREKMPKHHKSELINHLRLLYDVVMKQTDELDMHQEKIKEHEDIMGRQEQRITDLERIAQNCLIWRIEDYNRKLKEAKAGNQDTLFSPTFTTSKHGYRLCASVCLNGDGKGKGTHTSVFISILKGAYDALLKWPFNYRVTFILLDQNENLAERKHIKFSIKPNPIPENAPFLDRPRMEKNASFGGAKFAKHEEIENGSYSKDDTLFIKIVVDCDGLSEP